MQFVLFAAQSESFARTVGHVAFILIMLNGYRVIFRAASKPAGKIVAKGLWGVVSSKLK